MQATTGVCGQHPTLKLSHSRHPFKRQKRIGPSRKIMTASRIVPLDTTTPGAGSQHTDA
jgi:hypothetical protein